MSIEFTEFMLPNGKRRPVNIDRPDQIEDKARKIVEAGYVFECEVLRTGMISLTVADPHEDRDVEIVLVPNGPQVPVGVDTLVERAYTRILT